MCVVGVIFVNRSWSTEPSKVREVANKIMTWDKYDDFDGMASLDIWVMRGAIFTGGPNELLIVGDSPDGNIKNTANSIIENPDMEEEMDLPDDEEMDLPDDVEILEEGTREYTVKGAAIKFEFKKMKSESSGALLTELTGVVQGNENPTFLMLRLNDSNFNDEQIKELIESIK